MTSSKRASDLVGAEIRRRRLDLDLTAEQLAAKCAEIGAPELSTAVIANIETGRRNKETGERRRDITVEELLILANVLDTSPLTLLMPEPGTDLAVTPELVIHAHQVVLWLSGERPAAGLPTVRFEKHTARVRWHRAVYDAERSAKRADQTSRWARKNGDEEAADRHLEESRGHVKDMADVLNSMIAAGVEPPLIDPGWAQLMVTRGWVKDPDAIRTVDLSDLDED